MKHTFAQQLTDARGNNYASSSNSSCFKACALEEEDDDDAEAIAFLHNTHQIKLIHLQQPVATVRATGTY
jgi:hypothetical protein